MKSARWGILATDVEGWGATPGNVPQPKAKAKVKAKASMEPGPKDGNGQRKEKAWAKVRASLDCWVSATDAVSMAIVSPVARNGRFVAIEQNGEVEARKKPCKKFVCILVKPKIKNDESICSPGGRG